MKNTEQFYNMSYQLTLMMPDNIKMYFTNDLQNIPIQNEIYNIMKEWCNTESISISCTPSLQQFILYILSTNISKNISISKLRTISNTSRRDRKKYLYKVVCEEKNGTMTSQNPQYLTQNAQMYFELMHTNPSIPYYESIDCYIEEQFEKITEWASNSKYDISLFMFFNKIGAKRIAKCLEYDLAYHIFDIIHNEYYDNPIDGYLLKTPRGTYDNNLFSLVSTEMPIEYEVSNSQITVYSDYETTTDSGTQKIHTYINSLSGDFRETIVAGKQNELINQLRIDKELTSYAKVLDSMDFHILNTIYSMFNVLDVNSGSKKIRLVDIVSACYSQTSKRTYLPTIERIIKLAGQRIDIIQETQTGKISGGGRISFFDVLYRFVNENNEEQSISSIDFMDGYGTNSLIERLKDCDLTKMVLEIQPSPFFKESIKNQMNYSIMKNIYNQIAPVKAKNILMYLQSIRTNIYPATTTVISFSNLEEQLHLPKLKKRELENHIIEPFSLLKESNIVVKDFHIQKTSKIITIEFFSFTDLEKNFYNIDVSTSYYLDND